LTRSLDRALARLTTEIADGLRHGFFDYSIECEIGNREQRQLVLRAGKSYRFLIPKDECVPSSTTPATGAPKSTDQTPSIVEMTSPRQASSDVTFGCESLVADGISM
jgi:hypothetical protein